MAIATRTVRDRGVIAVRVLDDAHLTWVAAEIESEDTLRAWFDADARQRAAAYLAYRAAVDREEAAARDLQRLYALTQSPSCGGRGAPSGLRPTLTPTPNRAAPSSNGRSIGCPAREGRERYADAPRASRSDPPTTRCSGRGLRIA